MVITNLILFSVQTLTYDQTALINLFFRVKTRTTQPFMATPGGGKDATVIGTLRVAVGVVGKVIKVKRTPRRLRCRSGVEMLTGASLSLRKAVVRVCSVEFPSRG